MKKVLLAALTILSLGAGAANAQSFTHAAPPSHQQSGSQYNWLAGGGG